MLSVVVVFVSVFFLLLLSPLASKATAATAAAPSTAEATHARASSRALLEQKRELWSTRSEFMVPKQDWKMAIDPTKKELEEKKEKTLCRNPPPLLLLQIEEASGSADRELARARESVWGPRSRKRARGAFL